MLNPVCLFILMVGLLISGNTATAVSAKSSNLISFEVERASTRPILTSALEAMAAQRMWQAEKELRQVLSIEPNNSTAMLNLAFVLLAVHKPAAAVVEARKLITLQPENAEGWINLGACEISNGNSAQALHAYKMAMKLQPEHVNANKIRSLIQGLEDSVNNSNLIGTSKSDYLQSTFWHPVRWSEKQMPLKVYIQSGSEIAGYKTQFLPILKRSFDEWSEASGGKIKFIYVAVKPRCDIAVRWTSDPKELMAAAENGHATVYEKAGDAKSADITLFTRNHNSGTSLTDDYAHYTDLHEIGHAIGISDHSLNANDVMYGFGNPAVLHELSNRDKRTVAMMWDDLSQLKWLVSGMLSGYPWSLPQIEKSFGAAQIRQKASADEMREFLFPTSTTKHNWGLWNEISVESTPDLNDKLMASEVHFLCRKNNITQQQIVKTFGRPKGQLLNPQGKTSGHYVAFICYEKKVATNPDVTVSFEFVGTSAHDTLLSSVTFFDDTVRLQKF